MTEPFLPFSKPTINDAAINEVVECLKSGWITTGPRVKKFEEMLKEYFNAPYVLALTSGTAGLHLAVLALNLQPGDEVIAPAMTFVASYNMIVAGGGKPVLVDVDPITYNMNVTKIEKAITPKTRAIMPVHMTGLSCDLDPIYDLAKKYNLRVIEDAAQAIGAKYKNKLVGSFGDMQIFSFHPNKNITSGEGGCIVTRDEKIAKQVSVMRFHGIDRDAFNRFSKEGSQHYDVIAPGFKYNMLDMQAAIAIHQLPEIGNFNKRRTELALRYNELFKGWTEIAPPLATPTHYEQTPPWHLYAPLIKNMDRDDFLQQMKDRNIGLGLHYDAPHLYSYYQKNFGYREGDFPHAEMIGKQIVSLPLFPLMTEQEQDRVVNTMKDILHKGQK